MFKNLGSIIPLTRAKANFSKLNRSALKNRVKELLEIIKIDPYQTAPTYERLSGDLKGAYSRRINIQHRLVYQIIEDVATIKVLRMWTHYE